MGWNAEHLTWADIESALSDRTPRRGDGRARTAEPGRDGGDSPAWSNHRLSYEPPVAFERRPDAGLVPYAELHCHTNFSFLDGASHPEELVEEAARLGLDAIAITDHDGLYGVVRFSEAARSLGVPTVIGAELSLDLTRPQNGVADPEGLHLLTLADGPAGYARLARTISEAHLGRPVDAVGPLDPSARPPSVTRRARGTNAPRRVAARAAGETGHGPGDLVAPGVAPRRPPVESGRWPQGEKGRPRLDLEQAASHLAGHSVVLTGCRKGTVPAALIADGPAAARRELDRLVSLFGRDRVVVELWDHGDPVDSARNDALAGLAVSFGLPVVATNNVHYATPARRRLATALAAVRARRSLDEIDGWLPSAASACLRSGVEQERRFARWPGAVEMAARLARDLAFDLRLVAPNLPGYPVGAGETEMTFLRRIVEEGGIRRYGPRHAPQTGAERAWQQIDHELEVIEGLGFPGYFLIVWDIVEFCRRHDIYCQGRGSAANSAVCFALGITNADAIKLGLLFERFLSSERDGPPDIDIDIESGRREEVIQYVYERYGRDRAAQVANVITYRARSAVRDMGKALGASQGQVDAWSKQLDPWGRVAKTVAMQATEPSDPSAVPEHVLRLAQEVEDFPRHLGIHSGGMVLCDRPVVEVCPVEWGRMEGRTVLQWDKDDCAAAGLVKFDLLGLGMLTMLHDAVDLIELSTGERVDLATIPQEDEVYEMLCQADTIGVFQIESRAQMATLPRLKPRAFYDLVVEVALIRPGPIQGGSVHPYIRRRNGQEEVTYLHPLMERALKKTLGVPLFQEQLMQLAIDVAGFTPTESDQLRQAMGSKRSSERMERLRRRLYEGMAERGIVGDVADQLWTKLSAFANYGFPESHSVSFAYLVYASSWVKYHHPAAFAAALVNSQPMGFWSPQTICADARRHGVEIRGVDLHASSANATLEPSSTSTGGLAVRLGLKEVRTVGLERAEEIELAAKEGGPFTSMEDLVRRVPSLTLPCLEALATAGAFGCFGLSRREALWAAGAVSQSKPDRLAGIVTGTDAPVLPGLTDVEHEAFDLWATGISDGSPVRFVRHRLDARGVLTSAATADRSIDPGTRVLVAGVVTHRQRPATAQGVTFLNLEDETGLLNIVISVGCWKAHRRLAQAGKALVVRGILERTPEGVVNIVADRLEPLDLSVTGRGSRDFR